MRYTNRLGLPEPYVRAVSSFTTPQERRMGADISVTELLDAPMAVHLKNTHHDDVVVDVADRLWSARGQALHRLMEEKAGGMIAERRLMRTHDGMSISGQFDLMSGVHLWDYKDTKVGQVMREDTLEKWEAQQNLYAWMLRLPDTVDCLTGLPIGDDAVRVESLNIMAMCKDWVRADSLRSMDYPQHAIVLPTFPIWPDAKVEAFVSGRVAAHRESPVPVCLPEERWARTAGWAVMKKGAKRALRVLFDKPGATAKEQAEAWAENYRSTNIGADLVLEERRSGDIRCLYYCDYWSFCPHGQKVRGAELEDCPE